MSDEKPTADELAAKAAREKALAEAEAKAKAINDAREGLGTRILVGSTRGRQSAPFSYEAFDESKPETCPASVDSFMTLVSLPTDEGAADKVLVNYLIKGFNAVSEDAASDPISQYVDLAWPEEVQKRFKIVIRNYSTDSNMSIEDTVTLLKPGIVKGMLAMKAASDATAAVVGA